MKDSRLEEYCLRKPGTEKEFKAEWNAILYKVGGKMFVMLGGDKEEKPILTLKLDPLRGDALRREYPGTVVPGYYMNKTHWNSIYRERPFPDTLLQELLDESWRLVLHSLPQKTQKEIQGE